nr:hypothetical protein [Tanacetum cinerariifolium]
MSKSRFIIKITKHECLKPLQIKTTLHKKLSINQECQELSSNPSKDRDLDFWEKFKTSTLGEIVSLEKSNKNVIGQLTSDDVMAQLKEMKRLADLKAEKEKYEKSLQKIMDHAIIKAQAQKMVEYEAKRKKMLDEYNH